MGEPMKQVTLAAGKGFEMHARPTRKAEFLENMDRLMPCILWLELCVLVEPHHSKAGNGPLPIGL